ncbi:MAG TPA: hypothetical protein DCM28_02670, partial [Phycisphaerales bacterium]|nr:hypothetical protein [Phycisphaerales bacterium]
KFIESRGRACSVYAAQYLLEALYDANSAEHALTLMTATNDRSWYHMIEQGSTMTLEAWAYRYKSNLDWNHAWATAPLNIIVRKLMGIEPIEPGFTTIRFDPKPASLTDGRLKLPTPLGTIHATFKQGSDGQQTYQLSVPTGINVQMSDEVSAVTRIEKI